MYIEQGWGGVEVVAAAHSELTVKERERVKRATVKIIKENKYIAKFTLKHIRTHIFQPSLTWAWLRVEQYKHCEKKNIY